MWEIIPTILDEMMRDKDTAKPNCVMKALLQMKKLDIKTLKKAYAGE